MKPRSSVPGRLTGGGVVAVASVVSVGSVVSECVLVIGTRVMVAEVGVASVVRLPPNASHSPATAAAANTATAAAIPIMAPRPRWRRGELVWGGLGAAVTLIALTLIAAADAARASSPADGQRLAG